MAVFKICAAAILSLFIIIIMREAKSSLTPTLKIAVIIFMAFTALGAYVPMYRQLLDIGSESALAKYMPLIIRSLGVAMLTRICADVCRDGGEGGLAFCVETAGKAEMLVIALPLVRELISNAQSLLAL